MAEVDIDLLAAHASGSGDDSTPSRIERRRDALANALVDATELHRLPKPEPLVTDLIDRNSLCWLQGKPGHAKSFVALDLTCHVATGRRWRERDVTQGRVLYVLAEGASGMEQRLHAWEIGNNARVPRGAVTFLPVAVQMLDNVDVQAIRQVVAEVRPVMIVVDTQARVTVGGEENSAKDMGRFVEAADQLRRECGPTVLIVHHEARNGENLRGSTAMEGAATTIMRTKKDGALVELTCEKQKDAAEFAPIFGTLVSAGTSVYWSQGTAGLMQVETDTENRIYAAMRDLYETTGASTSTLIETTGLAKSSFHRGLQSLVRKGLLRNDGSKTRTLWVLSDQDAQVVAP